ncbi:GreA/GreB family elongation factor [Peristeroidobacter agariperforans]|uniref:GreA/GreB family elongation factor n=1 Tax=Peristeroidobacter agariperforans TaxID=268404 RepID=UPI0018E524FE|nr:GreA/GreB family elongation factor [Peristeroidobacter agariperforans]
MRDHPIVISEPDARVLRGLLSTRAPRGHDQEHLEELSLELERAQVLKPEQVAADVVTMHKPVRILDLSNGARQELTLVGPAEANVSARRISVLAPLGTALLGYREGDEVEWLMPGGVRRIRIESVQSAHVGAH